MIDLIDRQDVNDLISKLCNLCGESKKNNGVMCGACNLDSFIREFDEIPSAEPERKKGKWIDGLPYINSHWWVCSVCHVSAPENHTGYNFCPNCGARMTRGGR